MEMISTTQVRALASCIQMKAAILFTTVMFAVAAVSLLQLAFSSSLALLAQRPELLFELVSACVLCMTKRDEAALSSACRECVFKADVWNHDAECVLMCFARIAAAAADTSTPLRPYFSQLAVCLPRTQPQWLQVSCRSYDCCFNMHDIVTASLGHLLCN